MKNAKISLFVLALTLSVGISSGVYACEQNKDTKGVKPTSVAQKIDFKDEKTKKWDAKFLKNHEDNVEFSDKKIASRDEKNQEWAKKYTKNHKNKCKDIKVELTAEQKAALKVKMTELAAVKDANKVLKTEIVKNAEAVKAELKRIEDNKLLLLDPTLKAQADAALLEVKDATTKNDCVKPAVTPVVTPVVAPVVPVVDPTVPVIPVEKTYLEKLNEKLDNAFQKYTEKNTALTTLGAKLLTLLNALTLIK